MRGIENDLVLFDARLVEQILDQVEQMVGAAFDRPQLPQRIKIVRQGLRQQVRITQHRGQGCAEFVRHTRDKQALQAVGFRERSLRLPQFAQELFLAMLQ